MTAARLRAGLAVLLTLGAGGVAQAACGPETVTITGAVGRVDFTVTVADEPAERSQGLMFVEEMDLLEGMLFVYDEPQRASFWMRNTLIPLDMLFADPSGTITRIHPEAVPLDESVIDGGEGVRFVLEINGGLAARLGIAEGDVLSHPAIGNCPAS